MTWSALSSGPISVRYCENGFMFDSKGASLFVKDKEDILYTLGFMNSSIAMQYLEILCPTLDYSVGGIGNIPFIKGDCTEVTELVKNSIELTKNDWDLNETSWDFKKNPLLMMKNNKDSYEIRVIINEFIQNSQNKIKILQRNEQSINQKFIKIYGLEGKVSDKVEDVNVSVKCKDQSTIVKEFISYAVGCIFGRYSLDEDGMISHFDRKKFISFSPDEDSIIPITDEEYFSDDIVMKFFDFLKISFGDKYFEENLEFIATNLSEKGSTSREIVRNYFIKDFYKDHCNLYNFLGVGKRPIYWLFDSGKHNGFKVLIYMHRYDRDTVGRIRSDYLHKTQNAIEGALKNAEYIISTSTSAVDKARATKDRDKYIKQLSEIRIYDQALAHVALQRIDIDLDDGVKHNYELFQGVEISNEGTKKQTIDLLAKI